MNDRCQQISTGQRRAKERMNQINLGGLRRWGLDSGRFGLQQSCIVVLCRPEFRIQAGETMDTTKTWVCNKRNGENGEDPSRAILMVSNQALLHTQSGIASRIKKSPDGPLFSPSTSFCSFSSSSVRIPTPRCPSPQLRFDLSLPTCSLTGQLA